MLLGVMATKAMGTTFAPNAIPNYRQNLEGIETVEAILVFLVRIQHARLPVKLKEGMLRCLLAPSVEKGDFREERWCCAKVLRDTYYLVQIIRLGNVAVSLFGYLARVGVSK